LKTSNRKLIRLKRKGLPVNDRMLAVAKIGADVACDFIMEKMHEFVEEKSGVKVEILKKMFQKELGEDTKSLVRASTLRNRFSSRRKARLKKTGL